MQILRRFGGNPYRILGVPLDASEEDIKEAYFKLAKQFHPDVSPGSTVSLKKEMFKLVNEAYGQLKGRGRKKVEKAYASPEAKNMLYKTWSDFNIHEEKQTFFKFSTKKPFRNLESLAMS